MMDRTTGKPLDKAAHIRQSIADILFTPIGTRIQRRTYGSLVSQLIDRPLNDALRLQIASATVMALIEWEPRIRVTKAHVSDPTMDGRCTLEIEAMEVDEGQSLSFSYELGGSA